VRAAMERQGSAADDRRSAKSFNPQSPARIVGVHLEGPYLNPDMAGSLDPSSFLDPREGDLRRLIEGFEDMIRTVTIAPEREGALNLIKTMRRAGILVNLGHSNATFQEAEAAFRAGARGITHLFNAMAGFHHREPGLSGFGLLNQEVYVEVIGDMAHLGKQTLELVFRMKRPDRIILVSDSVRETSSSTGIAPRSGNETLLGGSATLPQVAERLIAEGFDEERVMNAATINPLTFLASA
jgi:N-acetylglucosamine-6-phosphate deacetylase